MHYESIVGNRITTSRRLRSKCFSLDIDDPAKELVPEDLIHLILGYCSPLERRYAYLIMHTDMFEHAISLRDGDGKLFWEELDGHPHWLGIPTIIDDNAAKPLYLVSMPLVLLPGYLQYPRKEDNSGWPNDSGG